MIVWLTGNSGAGKSTLARALQRRYARTVILDGDEMRAAISRDEGFSFDCRRKHNLRVARLANTLESQGHLVVVAVIAPYQAIRDEIDQLCAPMWVWVKRSGIEHPDRPYEPPTDTAVIDHDALSISAAADALQQLVDAMDSPTYIVTGHPRSGTSMLMQALEAGGMQVLRSAGRDAQMLERHSDDRYKMNPRSLYEPPQGAYMDPSFPAMHKRKAVKVVFPMARRMAVGSYHIVCMRRDAEEIRQSAEAAYGARLTLQEIEQEVEQGLAVLRNRRDVMSLQQLQYADVIADPISALSGLHWPISVEKAAQVVSPPMHRFRRELLVEGLSCQ